MAHKEVSYTKLTCDWFGCKTEVKVDSHCRPEGWTFITFQDDKFVKPVEKHFCSTCSFHKIKVPFKIGNESE